MPAIHSIGLVQQFVDRAGQLYSLPAIAMEVLRLTGEPTVDSRQLKDAIARDPALTTRILRVANSSLFGPARPVTDLTQALSLLGIRPLRMLVLGFSLPKELFSGLAAEVLARYWRQSLTKAVAARELAEQLWRVPGDDAFTAALVQDVGQLALIQQLGDSYIEFLDQAHARGGSLLAQELETLGFDHIVVSARLLTRWGLPPSLVAAVSVPCTEQNIAALEPHERQLPQILHLAELFARLLAQPYGSALQQLLDTGHRYCGLTFEQLQPMSHKLQTQVSELAEVLSLELPSGQNIVDLLLTARDRLADETIAIAAELAAIPEETLLATATRLQTELAAACRRSLANPTPATANAALADTQPPLRQNADPVCQAPPGNAVTEVARTRVIRSAQSLDTSSFPSLVAAAISRCRQARCPISVALIDIDSYDHLLLQLGPAGAAELVHWLQVGLLEWTGHRAPASLVGDSCFALIWEDCSRSEAVRSMRQALADAKVWWEGRSQRRGELTLSAGLATLEFPPRNFPTMQLVDAAYRCLSGAQLSGGDTLKSIVF